MLKAFRGRLYYHLHMFAFWAEVDGKFKAANIYRSIATYIVFGRLV